MDMFTVGCLVAYLVAPFVACFACCSKTFHSSHSIFSFILVNIIFETEMLACWFAKFLKHSITVHSFVTSCTDTDRNQTQIHKTMMGSQKQPTGAHELQCLGKRNNLSNALSTQTRYQKNSRKKKKNKKEVDEAEKKNKDRKWINSIVKHVGYNYLGEVWHWGYVQKSTVSISSHTKHKVQPVYWRKRRGTRKVNVSLTPFNPAHVPLELKKTKTKTKKKTKLGET